MLLLGIDTATRRVGVVLAIGEGDARAGSSSAAPPAAARRATPSSSCRRSATAASRRATPLRPRLGDRGRRRSRHVHRPARRRDDREGARAGAARPDDPDPEPRPDRVPAAARDGARGSRDRRAAQRGVLRALPDRARWCAARFATTRSARPTTSSPSSKRAARRRCSAATARCGSRARSPTSSEPSWPAPRTRRRASRRCRSWRSRRYEREEFCAPADVLAAVPAQSDAEIAWDRPKAPNVGRWRWRARKLIDPLEVHIVPMRRRHLRVGAAHRGAGVPDAVDARAVRERARAAVVTRVLRRRARRPRRRRLRRVDDDARPTVTSRRSPSTRTGSVHEIGTRLLLALAREAIARGATALTLEVRLSHHGAQASTSGSGSSPLACARATTSTPVRTR